MVRKNIAGEWKNLTESKVMLGGQECIIYKKEQERKENTLKGGAENVGRKISSFGG